MNVYTLLLCEVYVLSLKLRTKSDDAKSYNPSGDREVIASNIEA